VVDRVATVTITRPEYFSYEAHHESKRFDRPRRPITTSKRDHPGPVWADVFLNPKEMGTARAPNPRGAITGAIRLRMAAASSRIFSMSNSRYRGNQCDAFSLGATLALMV